MLLDIMAKGSYLLQGTIYSNRRTIESYYNGTRIGQGGQWRQGIMCQSTMGQWHAFWAEADCGNFGSLLWGMGHCSAAWSGSMWEPVEACRRCGRQWKQTGSRWKPVEAVEVVGNSGRHVGEGRGQKGCGRSGRGLEGHGKVRKRQEGTGSNGTLQVLSYHVLTLWVFCI